MVRATLEARGRTSPSCALNRIGLVRVTYPTDRAQFVPARMRANSSSAIRKSYIRRCQAEGIFAAVRWHGADEAGAIFIKVNRLDGNADLYGTTPAPWASRLV